MRYTALAAISYTKSDFLSSVLVVHNFTGLKFFKDSG